MNLAAQALGRLGRGKLKTLTPAERQRRSDFMRALNAKRIAAALDAVTDKAPPVIVGMAIGLAMVTVECWVMAR